MDFGLRDRIALIAGGSRGLGKAVAMEMCREGARVAICARGDEELQRAVEEIVSTTGAEAIGIPCDLSDPEQARGFVRTGVKHFGTVDILVNNAGGPPSATFLEITDDLWLQGLRLNLMSTINMTREAAPIMVEKRRGRIINITSVAVKQPIDGLILSNTVRSGVIGLAKTLSNELAAYNITVNNVCPGYILTERVRSLAAVVAEREKSKPDVVIKRWESTIPMGRMGTPEELAALVVFLASEKASYITGASIQIDGGYYKGIM
jgi:3-oxoacyl-[acyl-carrier protein] reductase